MREMEFKIGERVICLMMDASGRVSGFHRERGWIVKVKPSSEAYVGVSGKRQYLDVEYLSRDGKLHVASNFFECELELDLNGVELMLELL